MPRPTGSVRYDNSGRVVAVTGAAELDTEEPHRRIGTMGGDHIDFGQAGSIALAEATEIFRNALPRRLH